MAKQLVHDYTFDAANSRVTLNYVYKPERLMIITNVNDGKIIYLFNDAGLGASISYDYDAEQTIIDLTYNCTSMDANDKLQIFVEKDNQHFEPSETFVDPVSKIRVSQPENLIDTDFEYGLQSTKWETLELVKNIPTFFARNGDTTYNVADITTTENSDTVVVTLNENHNLLPGSPVIISGTNQISCDGTYVVTSIPSATVFRYKAKALQTFTGSIFNGVSTQIFAGSRYQGTEFTLDTIDTIVTDGTSQSNLTVNTEFPTNFTLGTSFYLTNSLAPTVYEANAALVEANLAYYSNTIVINNTPTGESGFSIGAVQPYDYTGREAFYFLANTTVNASAGVESITFSEPHGLIDNKWYLYVAGEGNTGIGGLTNYVGYVVRVIDETSIYLTTAVGSTTRVNLTAAGVSGGVMRSAFLRGYRCSGASTTAEYIVLNEDPLILDRNTPVMFFNGSTPNMTTNTTLFTPTVYYKFDQLSSNWMRFSTTPTGGLINLTSGTATSLMVPAVLLNNRDSIYVQNHRMNTGDAVIINLKSGTIPGGLGNGTTYQAQKVDNNRIQFLNPTTGALVPITSIGTAVSQFIVRGNVTILENDSIFIPGHEIPDGTAITYSNEGNANIEGLTSGASYYTFASTTNTFKLATTSAGWESANTKNFTQIATYVNSTSDIIVLTQSGTAHNYTTGDLVQYTSTTPMPGLTSGAFYYVRVVNATQIQLHWTRLGAINNHSRVDILAPFTGVGSIRRAELVDITAPSTGIHKFSAVLAGAADGVYTLTNLVSSTSFQIAGNATVGTRTFEILPSINLDLSRSAVYNAAHSLTTGTAVLYDSTETAIDGLVANTTYYVGRISRNWIKFADTVDNAIIGEYLTIGPGIGSGSHTLETSTISGEVAGTGTIDIENGATIVEGSGTNFSAVFTAGDSFTAFKSANLTLKRVTVTDALKNVFVSADHGLNSGDPVYITADVMPNGLNSSYIYYANANTSSNVTIHNTPANAIAGIGPIDFTSSGTNANILYLDSIGSAFTSSIDSVNGTGEIILDNAVDQEFANAEYAITTGLFVRADGFALHRPYDGGVELIPSTNPDSTMIRQTRKYFRYQSGKGIQVSFAVNFSPTTTIDNYSHYSEGGNYYGVIQTRYPHRLSVNGNIFVYGSTVTAGNNYWIGNKEVVALGGNDPSLSPDYAFTVGLEGAPDDSTAQGLSEYYVNNWTNSLLKCGLFDDQNGLYFEYNGQTLNCCRRSSVQQISGTVTVQFKSGLIIGTGTKFQTQLTVGDMIVIKGQSYKITEIASDTVMYILPSYRGIDATNVIVTRTVDTKIPQSEWNIDICDGTGPTGYVLDIHKIQMAYMDYSWYGAGKVRFGFKDQRGKVIYVHEFIHNNQFTEAYMRSGNLPARYEIQNTGAPSYVPALAHWGTSVIMDGRFDDDKAYVFTASSQTLSLTGQPTLTAPARVETTAYYYIFSQNQWRWAGYALLANASSSLNQVTSGMGISGTGIQAGTLLRNPIDGRITQSPYQPGVDSRLNFQSNTSSTSSRTLLIIDRQPTTPAAATSNYTITLSSTAGSITYEQPLISIRLAPSVDNGAIGDLGAREIINRMQLILSKVGILSTHAMEISLKLNGTLNNYNWERVQNPSLSQLVYHSTEDRITGGTTIYSFRAQGGTGTTGRTPVITAEDLGDIATLGNSIMGGDNVYPDGPDVLTVVARLVEDPSTVTTANPLVITGRISWSESQA